jgi:hypothetical protein
VAKPRQPRVTKYPRRAKKPGRVRITIELQERLARRLRAYCAIKDLDRDWVVGDAIRDRLKGFEVVDGTKGGEPELGVVAPPPSAGEREGAA